MRGRFNDLLILLNVRVRKANDIGPLIFWQEAGCMVEPIFFIRLFNIDLYIPVLQSLGMNNLCAVINNMGAE